MGNDARLSSARACQNKYRSGGGEHSFALLGIQSIENIHLLVGSGPEANAF